MLNDYQTYIHQSRYARWVPELGRRETWEETVTRYCSFWKERYPEIFPYKLVYDAILNMQVMPSMRALMTAGPALERDNIAGYNCSYIPVVDTRTFSEIMFILMNGTGVGYSVETDEVRQLPEVGTFNKSSLQSSHIVVEDSKEGWATALAELVDALYAGLTPTWDLSKLRPAGARLNTFGGRSSGPEPLNILFTYTVELFTKASGRRLTPIECSDFVCKIAQVVVVGGVRRSALICLSDLSDRGMQVYKSGTWWEEEGQRALANISAVYDGRPTMGVFMEEWHALYTSKSGERGIFNREAARKTSGFGGHRDPNQKWGTNPCGEIILRPYQFCNLSEVVIRETDTIETIAEKVKVASIIGTFQSTLTDFKFLRGDWKKNCEEERLLGVSLTGIMDNPLFSNNHAIDFNVMEGRLPLTLKFLRDTARNTNKAWAKMLDINPSAAITTVKPSGTVSQLVNSASGIHPRYSAYYVRTVRNSVNDPLSKFLVDQGVPHEVDVTNKDNLVFEFPMKSPDQSVQRDGLDACQALRHYLTYAEYWCEHNPSITVYVDEKEWMDVGALVYRIFDRIGGVSFLPKSDHIYAQAPYQEISQDEYESRVAKFPKINWKEFHKYEVDDALFNMHELACVGGQCELA